MGHDAGQRADRRIDPVFHIQLYVLELQKRGEIFRRKFNANLV